MGIQPDGNTFVALLCGCIHACLGDEGHKYFNSMGRMYSLTPTIEYYGKLVIEHYGKLAIEHYGCMVEIPN